MVSVWEAIFPMSLCSFLWRFVHLAENIEPIYWCKQVENGLLNRLNRSVWNDDSSSRTKLRRNEDCIRSIQNSSTSQYYCNCLKLRILMLVVNPIYAFTNTKDNLKRVFRSSRQKGQLKTFISLGWFCSAFVVKNGKMFCRAPSDNKSWFRVK